MARAPTQIRPSTDAANRGHQLAETQKQIAELQERVWHLAAQLLGAAEAHAYEHDADRREMVRLSRDLARRDAELQRAQATILIMAHRNAALENANRLDELEAIADELDDADADLMQRSGRALQDGKSA